MLDLPAPVEPIISIFSKDLISEIKFIEHLF